MLIRYGRESCCVKVAVLEVGEYNTLLLRSMGYADRGCLVLWCIHQVDNLR